MARFKSHLNGLKLKTSTSQSELYYKLETPNETRL